MAFKARLSDSIQPSGDYQLVVSVHYYDDQDPANANTSSTVPPTNILLARSWTLPLSTTTTQLQAAVVNEGQRFAAAYFAAQAARAAVPVGTIVTIPLP